MLLRLLIAIIVLAPLPFGSGPAWAWTLMGTLIGLLLLAWGIRTAVTPGALAIGPGRIWPLIVPFAATMLWMAAQMSPLVPEAWQHPLWRSAAEILGTPISGSISLVPSETGGGILRLLTYGGIFWIALQSCRAARDAEAVFVSLAVAGVAYALYGLAVEFSGSATILWFDKERYRDNLTSVFEYKNAYATYAGLGALCIVGLLLKGMEALADRNAGRTETLRRTVSWLAERGWPLIGAVVIMITALLLSDSRAGLLSFVVALAVLLLATRAIRGPRIPFIGAATAALAVAFVGFIAISGGAVLDRLALTDVETDVRPLIYEATERAIGDSPWLGTGGGTFDEVFPLYHPPEIYTRVLRAHSSYLENALELGIPAAVALTLAIGGTGIICLLGIRRRRRNALYPCIGVAATTLVGLHATIDFTMQVPAVAATYALMMGAACAQSWSTRTDDD